MNATKKMARLAGLWYLLLAITSILGLVYIPSKIIVPQNIHATIENIITSPMMFRLGIVSNLCYLVVFIFLVLAFYELFRDVNTKRARWMVIFVLMGVPIAFVNELNHMAVWLLITEKMILQILINTGSN